MDNCQDLKNRITSLETEFRKFLKPSDIIFKIQGLDDEFIEEVLDMENSKGRIIAVQCLINEIKANEDLLPKFVWALSECGYQRFSDPINDVYPDRGDKFSQKYFGFLISIMKGDLIDRLEPIELSGILYQNGCIESSDKEAIDQVKNMKGRFAACQELFFRARKRKEKWAILFFEAIKESRQEFIKQKMDPSATPEDLERAGIIVPSSSQEAVQNEGIEGNLRTEDDETQVKVVENQTVEEESRSGVDEISYGLDEVSLDNDGDVAYPDSDYDEEKYLKEGAEKDNFKTREIKLREYQNELAEKAVTGINTVICADTGSGKTWVALHIVKHHLEKDSETPLKVAFMARTNPLVQQQYTLFKHYLGENTVHIINKDEKSTVPLKKMLEFHDVFFFTPQILLNNIEKGNTKLTDFTLLILDECHHTAKGEPYNNLMRKYIKSKYRNPQTKLPQIVGLTASIGVGAATTEDGAISHMIKIFSNLDVDEISTVERNKEEMKQYVAIPTEEHVQMEVEYKNPCREMIERKIKGVEEIYEEIMKNNKVINTRNNLPGGDYLSKTYLGSIIKLKNQIMCDTTLAKGVGREMTCCLTHLSFFHEALDINYLMNVKHVIQFLEKRYEEECQHKEKLIPRERQLLQIGKTLITGLNNKGDIMPNPNLRKIEEKLQELFAAGGAESLGMIFVQTRATAKSLAEYLDEKLNGLEIHVKPFIGSKSSDSNDGMSETEKKELLESFRSHKIKLLVATSVGSEGIDVPECNIVIKYNYSGNEINIIQMRGRTRKAGGQAIYISDANVLRRDLVSMEKAAVMHRALDELKQKGKEEIQKLIKDEQSNEMKQQEDQDRKNRERENSKKRGDFKLVCSKCLKTEIDGGNIKLYKHNHHVAAERAFLNRVKKEDVKEERKINNMTKKSIIYCQECPQALGKIFLIHDLEVPLLKIQAFLCKEGEKLRKYKNWKFVPYVIDEISHQELEEIFPKSKPSQEINA